MRGWSRWSVLQCLSSPFGRLVWKIHVIWLPLRWFWLGRSAPGVLDPGSLAAINHGQARFHAHRSHTSSHSRPVAAQTVAVWSWPVKLGYKIEKGRSERTLIFLLLITHSAPNVLNCRHIVVMRNAFGSHIWRYVKKNVPDRKSSLFCHFVGYIFNIFLCSSLWM